MTQRDLFGGPSEVAPQRASGGQAFSLAALDAHAAAPDWQPWLAQFWGSTVGRGLRARLADRVAARALIYPPTPWRALELTPLAQVRVVILGQDPYHGPGQAQGLAFSVPRHVKVPPSLQNIFKELVRSGCLTAVPSHGNLEAWARQGVLLLNTCLTVEDGQPASHAKYGWEVLTDLLIQAVARKREPVAFLLWGAHAQAKRGLIEAEARRHLILTANHPSPLSARRPPQPFIGCGHFSQVGTWLAGQDAVPMAWTLG